MGQQKPKAYVRHQHMARDEDLNHEFKAHRCLSSRDLSTKLMSVSRTGVDEIRKTGFFRTPISKSICGMLNTGQGGAIHMGVTDSGQVEGLMMSEYQKDHFLLALQDLLDSFRPAVPKHLWKVTFVPVVDDPSGEVTPVISVPVDPRRRSLPHELRESRYCWCDCYTLANMENGLMEEFFVIELTLSAWDPDDPRNASLRVEGHDWLNPIFVNEDGNCSIRRNGQTVKVDLATLHSTIATRMAVRTLDTSNVEEIECLDGVKRKSEVEENEVDDDSGVQFDDQESDLPKQQLKRGSRNPESETKSFESLEYDTNCSMSRKFKATLSLFRERIKSKRESQQEI